MVNKENMNLKENREVYVGGFGGRKEKAAIFYNQVLLSFYYC